MTTPQNLAVVLGRVLIAAIFLIAGLGKITGYAATQGYMASMGVPGALLPLVIALEVGGALAIIVGWRTRLVAFLLAGAFFLPARHAALAGLARLTLVVAVGVGWLARETRSAAVVEATRRLLASLKH